MKARKFTKRGKVFSAIILAIFLLVCVSFALGVNIRKEIEEVLKKNYNREFTVLRTYNKAPGKICAVVKMNGVTNHIFEMFMGKDSGRISVMKSSEYVPYKVIAEKEIEERLNEDLKAFFPDFWVRTHYLSDIKPNKEIWDAYSVKDEDVINEFDLAINSGGGCFVHVFINSEQGLYKKFEQEYDYFKSTYDKYLQDRKTYPICITFFWITEEQVKEIQKITNENADENSYYSAIEKMRQKTACFIEDTKGYIDSLDEYISVRKELEEEH